MLKMEKLWLSFAVVDYNFHHPSPLAVLSRGDGRQLMGLLLDVAHVLHSLAKQTTAHPSMVCFCDVPNHLSALSPKKLNSYAMGSIWLVMDLFEK